MNIEDIKTITISKTNLVTGQIVYYFSIDGVVTPCGESLLNTIDLLREELKQ